MATRVPGYEKTFEIAFKTYFRPLHAYAYTFLRNEWQAEDVVQQVFYKLWEKQAELDIHSLQAYLYKSVYHECLNYLKKEKYKLKHSAHHKHAPVDHTAFFPEGKETEARVYRAINGLPQQCRTIFQLSRFEEMKYQQIADRLQLSVKTVEVQMSKALKVLRARLSDLLPAILFIIINPFK